MSEEKKSFNLKGWINKNIVEIEGGDEKSQDVAVKPQANAYIPNVTSVANNIGSGTISDKFLTHFEEVMKKLNLPGPDYIEFMSILDKMQSNPTLKLQEDQMFSTAWISFNAISGVADTSVLIAAANHYLTALEKDKADFTEQVKEKLDTSVGALKNSVASLEERNKKATEEIVRLQQEITNNNGEIMNINMKITEQSTKLVSNQNDYNVTHSQVVEQIKSDINKIQNYIK